jgi:tetratricopeptide (TPR) repeat protein
MRQSGVKWLGVLALAAGIGLAAGSGNATNSTEEDRIGTFSGAYLAARAAEVDNDLDAAIRFYERALSFDPDNQALQQSVMLALISKGSFDRALPYAEKLKTVPEVERFSRVALAVDAFRKKAYGEAENWLKLALESDLDRLISGLMTAWAKLGQDQGAEALALIEALEGPEWYGIFKSFHRALIAEAAGLKEEAAAAYEETIGNVAAGGGAPDTYLRAVEAYAGFLARQGDKEKALSVLAEAEKVSSGRPPLVALAEKIEAGEAIPPLVGNPGAGAGEVLYNLGAALNRGGGEAFVRLYLQLARVLKPSSDAVLLQLASVAEQQQESEEAIALYRLIPDESPYKRVAEMQLGLNLADLERHDEAISHLKALVEQDPDDLRAYLALGGVYASKEDYKASAELYDRAVAQLEEPTAADWNIFYQRGIAYERLKQWEKAEPNFRRALELSPDQPQVLNYLGYSWVDMDMNLEEGLEMIQKAVDLRPSDGYIVDSLGWAYYRLGRYEDAVRELERAVGLKPDDPVLNDHLGDAYWRVGRKLEARFQWSHARDMEPEPDVLESVNRKLAEGLPPVENEKAAAAPAETVEPVKPQAVPLPEAGPEERSDLAAPVVPVAAAGPAQYVVQPGQSLWSIAVDHLGDGTRYREILDLNPELQGDPARLRPGQSLRLPGAAN